MTAAFDPQRAVEVFGPVSYGSGYRVTSALVLTACHLFGNDPRGSAKVRDPRGRGGSARVAWASPRLDLALLELGPPEEGGLSATDDLPPAAIGRLSRSPGVILPFEMFGWPRAGAAHDGAGAWIRDPVHVVGEIRASELMGAQSRLVRLRPADRFPALADGSWWSGISGAGVFCGGLLVGVQVRQARPELPDFLAAQTIEGDEAGELIALLRAAGVTEEVALDPDATVIDGYLSRLGGRLDALPTWFPARLRTGYGTTGQLFQPPELGLAGGTTTVHGIEELAGDNTVTVVEGEAGAGKTWLVSAYARGLTTAARGELRADVARAPIRLPLLCRLADLQQDAGISGLLDAALAVAAVDPAELRRAVQRLAARRPVRMRLVVDGVDEADEAQKRTLVRAIDDFLTGLLPDVDGIILATRYGEFRTPRATRVTSLRLRPFALDRQRRLVAAWFAGTNPEAEGRVLAMTRHWRTGEAFRNPLLLTLTCVAAEQWGRELGTLHNVADIIHASVNTLIDGAHRDGALRSRGTVAQRRARRATVRTLMDLAARLFRDGSYRPSLGEHEIQDIPGEVLDSCLTTGLVTLRADDGLDFANRVVATYLAAHHHATARTWQGVLAVVWDDEGIGEIAALVPHALTRPLLGDAEPDLVARWFADAEAEMAAGDPGFLLLQVASRALSLLAGAAPLDGLLAEYTRTHLAHLAAAVDANTAESLAELAPDALERLSHDYDPDSAVGIGILLARVGYHQGYMLIRDRIDELAEQRLSTVVAILCWVTNRGDSQGTALLEELAGDGSTAVRRFAALCLALADGGDDSMRRLADALKATRRDTSFPSHTHIALGLLHESGHAFATQRLVRLWHNGKGPPLPTLYRWLGGKATDAAERLSTMLDDWAPRAIAAALCLVEIDRERGLDALHHLSQPDEWDGADRSEDVVEAAAAAYRLARLEPERGMARLTALTTDPRFVAVQAAVAIHLLDEERGSDALVRLAEDAATELEFQIAAARLLQFYGHGHGDGDRLLAHIVDRGGEEAHRKSEALTEQHAVVAVRQLTKIEEETDEILASPREALLHLVATYPQETQRGAVLPDDPDEILLGPGVIDSGLTPYLNRLDLDQALDQRALAVAIPVFDAPLDRNYLVASALARAPHALELQRYLGAWSVGALEDSPIWIFSDDESRPEVAKWAEAVARAMAVFDIAGWVVTAIWGDLSKVVYRCLALAFRHPTPEVLLEIAHRTESPIDPMISVPLNGIRPMPGLAAPAVRACVGRTCLSTVAEALAETDTDTDTDVVRSAYADRIVGLACDHHT